MPARLWIVLKKDFKTEVRLVIKLVIEIVIILLIFCLVVWNPDSSASCKLTKEQANNTTFLAEKEIGTYYDKIPANLSNLAFTPDTVYSQTITRKIADALNIGQTIAFESEEKMEKEFEYETTLAGLVFSSDTDEVPTTLDVAIRFPFKFRNYESKENISNNYWLTRKSGVISADENLIKLKPEDEQTDLYLIEGFLQLQHLVFMEWYKLYFAGNATRKLEKASGANPINRTLHDSRIVVIPPDSNVIRLGHIVYDTNYTQCQHDMPSSLIGFIYCFTFLYPFLNLVQKFGRECEENIMVHHINYGCTFLHHYFCHFLVALLHLLLLDLIIIMMIKIPWTNDESSGIFYDTGIAFLLVYLVVYNIALILFVFFIVPWFSCAKHAVYFGLALWLASCGLSTLLWKFAKSKFSAMLYVSTILFFNNCFAYSMDYMKHRAKNDPWLLLLPLLGNIFLVFLVLCVCQFFQPGPYIRRTLCALFCCKGLKPEARPATYKSLAENTRKVNPLLFEEESMSGVAFVTVRNICLHCGANKQNNFLQDVTFTAYRGELTVILGHRNSGKTTLLAVIAGWKYPSQGRVEYMGEEIFKNWTKSRAMADVTMTNNKLFDYLTGKETLRYFITIKQELTKQKLTLEQNKWLTILQPVLPKPNILVRKMTFEQKRLLCLCCTMASDTRIVLIDEPTRYMRATEQRLYWKILREEKATRAIIVATHSIDEAEQIADKIIMLNEGTIVANATPFHLKTNSSAYYRLTVIKKPNASTDTILERIKRVIPGSMLKDDNGDEVVFLIPADQRKVYQLMLIHLESDADELGILNISVSGGDIGDVYMKEGIRVNKQVFSEIDVGMQKKEARKVVLWLKQFVATLYKKAIYLASTWFPVLLFVICILVIAFVGVSSLVLRHVQKVEVSADLSPHAKLLSENDKKCEFYEVDMNSHEMCGDEDYKKYVGSKTTQLDKKASVVYDKENYVYTCWIHQPMFHTALSSLNLAHNLIIMRDFPDDDTWVVTRNKPFPTDDTIAHHMQHRELGYLHVAVVLGILLPLLVAAVIRLLMAERLFHVLILQRIAGMRMEVYWVATMLWDYVIYLILAIVFIGFMAIANKAIASSPFIGAYILLAFAYGFAGIAATYLLSALLLTTVFAAFMLAFILQLIGFCVYILSYDVINQSEAFKYFGLILPTFGVLHGLGLSYERVSLMDACKDICKATSQCPEDLCDWWPECCTKNFMTFEDPGILLFFLLILIHGIIMLSILAFISYWRRFRKFRHRKDLKLYRTVVYSYDDSDVTAIRKKIADADINTCKSMIMVVDQIENKIPKQGKMLNTVSFALNSYAILGIFGKQRSGKSHLAKQLIAEDSFYFGDVYINGLEVKFDLTKVYKQLGYCPQDYGLLDAFTAVQYMRFFCMVRGLPKDDADAVIRNLIAALDMKKFAARRMRTLNADKRRKVNVAVAFIVYTKVVVLDEPSNGLKASTRTEIANVLRYAKSSGKVIILVSSDSTEMRVTNQVMMVDDGEMLTYGSMNSIFSKNIKGFVLEVQLYHRNEGDPRDEADLLKDADNLNRFVSWLHEESELHSRNRNLFKYYVPVRQVTFSYLFGTMEKNRGRLNIKEYHVSLGTIDTVMRTITDKRIHRKSK